MVSQIIEQIPRPRRFSFTALMRQQPQPDIPLIKAEPPEVITTIGYPIDALPLYTETKPPIMERREICVSPTWKKDSSKKPRGRSQSVPPSMEGEAHHQHRRQSSRRLVKKQPPVTTPKQQQQQHSRRGSNASSSDNNNTYTNNNRFGLISSISTRIRSRRPSISRSATTPDGNLPTLYGPRQSEQLNAIPAPRVSATLPPGFGATITRDLKQGGPGPVLAHPQQQQQVGQIVNGYAAHSLEGEEKTHTLRRAGATIHQPLSDEASRHFQSGNTTTANNRPLHQDTLNTRPIKNHSDRKDITIPDSLRIGRSKKIEPGPKSPKRATRPTTNNNNPPNYSLPKTSLQKQEQTVTCKDCQQKNSRALENIGQNTGSQNTTSISKPTSPDNQSPEVPWPLPLKISPEKEDNNKTSKPDSKESTPTPNTAKRLSPQQPPTVTVSRDSAATNDDLSTLVADSPALSNPPEIAAGNILSKTTTNQEKNAAASSTDTTTSSARNSAMISPRAPLAAQTKEKIPRNTMSPIQDKYLAKIFVVCCQCNFWHDIPSALYAKMIIPEHHVFSEQRSGSAAENRLSGQAARENGGIRNMAARSHSQSNSTKVPDNTVQCCWCSHAMAKACCTGWTTMVHLLEKHH